MSVFPRDNKEIYLGCRLTFQHHEVTRSLQMGEWVAYHQHPDLRPSLASQFVWKLLFYILLTCVVKFCAMTCWAFYFYSYWYFNRLFFFFDLGAWTTRAQNRYINDHFACITLGFIKLKKLNFETNLGRVSLINPIFGFFSKSLAPSFYKLGNTLVSSKKSKNLYQSFLRENSKKNG